MKHLSEHKKSLLKAFTGYKCEICHKVHDSVELVIHRIKRGRSGGLYTLNNIRVICNGCHKKIHFKESF